MNANSRKTGDSEMDVITGTLVKAGADAVIKYALNCVGVVMDDRRRARSLEAAVREAIDAQVARAQKPAEILACLLVPAFSEALQHIQKMTPLHENQIRSWLEDQSKMKVSDVALDVFLNDVRDATLGEEGFTRNEFRTLGGKQIDNTTFPVFYRLIRDIEDRFVVIERESMAVGSPASYAYALQQRVLQIDRRLETMWRFIQASAVFFVAYFVVVFGIQGIEQVKGVVLSSGILDEILGLVAGGTSATLIARLLKKSE
jgi:hypothetical protein